MLEKPLSSLHVIITRLALLLFFGCICAIRGGDKGVDGKIEVDHFSKTWASFVDIADYVEKIKAKIVITWPRDCSFWGWNRVKRFAERFNLVKASIPRLIEPRLEHSAHYTLASNEQSLVGILKKQNKKQQSVKSRNNAESHSSLDCIMKRVVALHRDNKLLPPAAIALKHQAFPASFSRLRSLAKMSGSAFASTGRRRPGGRASSGRWCLCHGGS